jgi:hypothetical protein
MRNSSAMGVHDPPLCARGVILLEQGNDIKEMGANVVVEKLGRYKGRIGS